MISKSTVIIVSLCALLAITSTVVSQPRPAATGNIFSTLAVGQVVTINDKGALIQISTIEGADAGTHKIVDLAGDYVVMEDIARVSEMRVPLHAIKAILHVRAKAK